MLRAISGPTVHVGKAWRLILSDLGLSIPTVLRRAGLPTGVLDGEGTRIALDEYFVLWETMVDEARDPELALRLGQVASVELFDPALFAAICSPDMNTAARRLGEFKRLVGAFSLDVEIKKDVTEISYRCKFRPTVPLMMGLSEIVFLLSFARRATRQNLVPEQVIVPSDLPSMDVYQDWFGCSVSKGNSITLTFSAQDASAPFLTHDDQMWAFFEPALQRRMDDAKSEATIRTRVEHALTELLPSGRTRIEDVARELAISKRSLQRRLSEEGTSWLEVLNGQREKLARHYLGSTNLGVGEVSFLLGFEDPNSLFRAFNRWTGTTPEAWRATLGS